MTPIDRREFIRRSAAAALAAAAAGPARNPLFAAEPAPAGTRTLLRAGDTVTLGKTGIQTSRLAIGTGTKVSRQREMGQRGMCKLWRHGLDQGVRWWEVADMYDTHDLVRSTLRQVKRDQVVITTKTMTRNPDGVRDDVERFRREMNTDYIDVLLLHCLTDPDWTAKMRGEMDALSQAKAKGRVRAVGCSCHSFEALQAAMNEPWVEFILARINPFAIIMDVNTPDEVPRVVDVLQTMHDRGKGTCGMKILGEGRIQGDRIDESLRFTLRQPYLDGFVVGFRSLDEFDDLCRRIERVQTAA